MFRLPEAGSGARIPVSAGWGSLVSVPHAARFAIFADPRMNRFGVCIVAGLQSGQFSLPGRNSVSGWETKVRFG